MHICASCHLQVASGKVYLLNNVLHFLVGMLEHSGVFAHAYKWRGPPLTICGSQEAYLMEGHLLTIEELEMNAKGDVDKQLFKLVH